MKQRIMKNRIAGILIFIICISKLVAGIKIKGLNGTEVEFSALFDARPTGLVVLASPDASAITIPWGKIDLKELKDSQPEIFKAYEQAIATQKDQPLGMGLAESMLSLGQLPDALKQAVRDPYNWPYEYYSYQTIYVDGQGKMVTRVYVNKYPNYPYGYISPYSPYIILKRMRDVQDDRTKKELFAQFKNGGYGTYGFNSMMERIDYVLTKIPPERMFPRKADEKILIQSVMQFKKTIEKMMTEDALTADAQSVIKNFLGKIGID